MTAEHKEAYLLDLQCADLLLARHLGPKTQVRLELAAERQRVEQLPVTTK